MMTKKYASSPPVLSKTKQYLNFLSNFHLILTSMQFVIVIGWWGQVRKATMEKSFIGCTSELKLYKDLVHGPQ